MKRVILMLLLAFVLLAGCGEKEATSTPQQPEASAETAKSDAANPEAAGDLAAPGVDTAEAETARLNEWLDAKF